MRLVLIHGREQGERDEPEIRVQWLDALSVGCANAGLEPLSSSVEVRVPFYGRLLDELTATPELPTGDVVSRGRGGTPDKFEAELLTQIAARAGVSADDVELPQAAERGVENWQWVRAVARDLSERSPWLSETLMRQLTRDVNAYMKRPAVRRQVNELVVAELGEGPAVVVGHSLGSIVAYWTLTDLPRTLDVPLFVTLGSPLGIPVIKKGLPRPLGMPRPAAAWFNAADPRDPVALFPELDHDNFPAPIENYPKVQNPHDNPHGIVGYLSDRVVARRIVEALA